LELLAQEAQDKVIEETKMPDFSEQGSRFQRGRRGIIAAAAAGRGGGGS